MAECNEEDYAMKAAREYFGEFGTITQVRRLAAIIRKYVEQLPICAECGKVHSLVC